MDAKEQRRRRSEVVALTVQAWSGILALLVAIPGVWLAYSAFRDQQTVNRDQQAITREQQAQHRQRYAVRVAYWDEFKDGAIVVHIQNRSPTPMHEATIRGEVTVGRVEGNGTYRFDALLETLPPCTLLEIRIRENDVRTVRSDLTAGGMRIQRPWRTVDLEFSDPVGRWMVGRDTAGRFRVWQVDKDQPNRPRGQGPQQRTFPNVLLTAPSSPAEVSLVTKVGSLPDCGD